MVDKIKESLSALMDGEVSEIEVHRLLKEVSANPELQQRWIAYQQIRSAIRKEPYFSTEAHLELTASLHASILEEDAYADESGRSPVGPARYLKPAGGFAIAASLVAAIFVGVQTTQIAETDVAPAGTEPTDLAGQQSAPSSAGGDRNSAPTSLVSNGGVSPATVDAGGSDLAMGSLGLDALGLDEGQPELRELDEERMRQVRAYLMRHDRLTRVNPYAIPATNRNKQGK